MENIVLLVDDDQNVLHGLARALRHQPYQLYTATSGEEAMLVLKARKVDVIVTDEQMPGMSGGDLRAWVAENCPEVTRIVLTGRPTVDTAIRAINEGAVYQFFTKPCNPARLGVAIRKALEHKALRLENDRLLEVNKHQMQELEKCISNIDALKNFLSHDILELLLTVSSTCKLLEDQYQEVFDYEAKSWLKSTLNGVEKVQRTINDIIDVSCDQYIEFPDERLAGDCGTFDSQRR